MEHKKHEIWAVFVFVLTLLVHLSLVSYHPADPTLFDRLEGWIPPVGWTGTKNWIGPVGAHLAWYLFGIFGLGAHLFPVLGLWLSWILYRGDFSSARARAVCPGFVLILVSTACLLQLQRPAGSSFGALLPSGSGGILGRYLSPLLADRLHPAGVHIVLIGALVIGLLLATPITLKSSWSVIKRALRFLGGVILRLARMFWREVNPPREELNPLPDPLLQVEPPAEERPQREPKRRRPPDEATVIEVLPATVAAEPGRRPRKALAPPPPVTAPGHYAFPSIELLDVYETENHKPDWKKLDENKAVLEVKLADFGVQGQVLDISPGPVITMYEYSPAPGIKISRIVGLSEDLAMALKAISIRVAPIPGKAAIGIEIPNAKREMVAVRTVLESDAFTKSSAPLTIALGKDITGQPVVANLARMPHLLIAGATGTGKSVCINTLLSSLLYRNTPDDVRLLLIDPKRIELSSYEGIPHLIHPVVTDAKMATRALKWAVCEMELRYKLLANKNVRNIESYNRAIAKDMQKAPGRTGGDEEKEELQHHHLPYLVIIIDELADLMMVASREVEESIIRLAQMARAAGIHLILATQRPSVDVLTGIIKANIPTRISFQVSSRIDSRTVIDMSGAESLLGAGDMLFLPPGTAKLQRIHGAFISETEVERLTKFWAVQQLAEDPLCDRVDFQEQASSDDIPEDELDEKYEEAVDIVEETKQASISMLQRKLRVGYNRAARMIEMMEYQGIVGPSDGIKPREVFGRRNS